MRLFLVSGSTPHDTKTSHLLSPSTQDVRSLGVKLLHCLSPTDALPLPLAPTD